MIANNVYAAFKTFKYFIFKMRKTHELRSYQLFIINYSVKLDLQFYNKAVMPIDV